MEKDLQVVGFRIGNETYGVRIAAVREIGKQTHRTLGALA